MGRPAIQRETAATEASSTVVVPAAVPPALRAAVDALFEDAARHGPRMPALARRIAPAAASFAAVLWLAGWMPWRTVLETTMSARAADVALVGPIFAAVVVFGWALAPLVRVPTIPLVLGGGGCMGLGLLLVHDGLLVVASLPSVFGALLLGVSAARVLQRAVWIVPILAAAAISDIRSVQGGVTDRLLDDVAGGASTQYLDPVFRIAPAALAPVDSFVLHLPAATGTWMLGLVDIVAVGMLLGLCHLQWRPEGRTAFALAGALVVTLLVSTAVPVLPVLGVAWILTNARLVWRATRFTMRRLTYLGG